MQHIFLLGKGMVAHNGVKILWKESEKCWAESCIKYIYKKVKNNTDGHIKMYFRGVCTFVVYSCVLLLCATRRVRWMEKLIN